jgi:hypothetical protein
MLVPWKHNHEIFLELLSPPTRPGLKNGEFKIFHSLGTPANLQEQFGSGWVPPPTLAFGATPHHRPLFRKLAVGRIPQLGTKTKDFR